MKRISYCFFSPQFLPHMGGVERYTYNLAKTLVKRGEKAIVITSLTDSLPRKELMDGIVVVRVPVVNLMGGRYPVVKFWKKEYRNVLKQIANHKNGAVCVVNTRFYLQSFLAALFAKKKGIKCLIVDHGTSHLSVHNAFLDRIGAAWEHFLTMLDRLVCKDYYAVSEASCEWLSHFHIKAKGVLYNAIDVSDMEILKKNRNERFRSELGIPNDACVISFTGRLLEEKGIYPLIESVEQICKRRNDVYLLLAGDGPLEGYVKEHQTEHIVPLGRLCYQDVISMLCESDIFCMPSVSEGFSTSILEAAFCKNYIITTWQGGSKELVVTKEYGSIIPSNKTDYVFDALIGAIDNPEERQAAAEKCYEKLVHDFTWNNTADRLQAIVEKGFD